MHPTVSGRRRAQLANQPHVRQWPEPDRMQPSPNAPAATSSEPPSRQTDLSLALLQSDFQPGGARAECPATRIVPSSMDAAALGRDPVDRRPSHSNLRPTEPSAFDRLAHLSRVAPLSLRPNVLGSPPSRHRMDEQPQQEVGSIPDHTAPAEASERKVNRWRADIPKNKYREQSPATSVPWSELRRQW